MTASVLKQDPNTKRLKQSDHSNLLCLDIAQCKIVYNSSLSPNISVFPRTESELTNSFTSDFFPFFLFLF